MNNYVIYDYLTFSSKIHDQLTMIMFLGLEGVSFENLKGFYGYRDRLYYDGISIHYNGRDDMGVCVEMSGKGCRAFEKFGNGDYNMIFSEILDNYSDDADKRQMNITRLDVAYDDFTGVLDLPLLCSETQKHNFVSRFQDWQVVLGNKGIAVNHGSMKSSVYIRIYDKRLEQNVQELLDHWVRCELQIRKENALGFIQKKLDIVENYFRTLNQYLRYVVPNDSDSNNRRLDTAPYWLRFLQSAERDSIFHKPADNYSFDKLYGFINNQLSGAISTYIDIVGVDQFVKDISDSRKSKKLNSKYSSMKAELGADVDRLKEFLDKEKKDGEDDEPKRTQPAS